MMTLLPKLNPAAQPGQCLLRVSARITAPGGGLSVEGLGAAFSLALAMEAPGSVAMLPKRTNLRVGKGGI